jgi:hypothetical protein
MYKLFFPAFAILSYSVSQKGYIPAVHNLGKYTVPNIVISLRSGLFKKILTSPDGVVIDSGSIKNDFFLKKIFETKDGECGTLYFVMLDFLLDELSGELTFPGQKAVTPFLPSPIYMVEIDEADGARGPAYVANSMKKRLSIPLFLMNESLSRNLAFMNFKGLSYPFYLLDYFFTVFLIRDDSVGMRIKLADSWDASTVFLMKYILSKLKHILSSDSAIIHILKNRLLILTKSDYIGPISEIIDTHNRLFQEQLDLLIFYTKDFDDSIRIIQEIILSN